MSHARRWGQISAVVVALSLWNGASVLAYTGIGFVAPGAYSIRSAERVTFQIGAVSIRCALTFRGELEAEEFVESVELANVNSIEWECQGGEITPVNNLPWTIFVARVLAEGATTPRENVQAIGIRIGKTLFGEGISFTTPDLGGVCRYTGHPTALISVENFGGLMLPRAWAYGLLTMRLSEERLFIGAADNHCGCPGTATMAGTLGMIEASRIVGVF